MAERGVRRCLELMRQWAGGIVSEGLVDNYPQPVTDTCGGSNSYGCAPLARH